MRNKIMIMRIKNRNFQTLKKKKIRKKPSRKKHVETMFITNKQKNYPYYFKPFSLQKLKISEQKSILTFRKIFYIKATKSCYLTLSPLKSILRIFKWFVKAHNLENSFKYKLFIFPDFVLTSKPKDVRMGKGKGSPKAKVCLVKKGKIIFSLIISDFFANRFLADQLLKQFKYKLPTHFIISCNFW